MTIGSEPVNLAVEAVTDGHRALLRLVGDLDVETADTLVSEAEVAVLQGHRHLVLDCADLRFCDVSGLRTMNELARRVQPDGSVTLADPSNLLLRILDIVGLRQNFKIACGQT